MDGFASDAAVAALQAGAPLGLLPHPEWLACHGDDPAYGWARMQWERAASVPGAWFDDAKAESVVRLWPRIFHLTEDRFAGESFKLSAYQDVTVRMLVGWKVPTEVLDVRTHLPSTVHVRLYRRLLLWVPRKNGKSEFLAALAIVFFALEGVVGGQGYVFARDEKQAKIIFDKMKAMLAFSPELKKEIQDFKKSLWIPRIRAAFELLAGQPEGKHGRSPTVIVGDEMHEWQTLELATTLRQGTGARLQPIELYASTAGLRTNRVGYGLWEESLGILEGRIEDPATLVVLFAAAADADIQDEAAWRVANPNLGLSPTLAFLRREAKLAKDNPRAESHFRRYHLNQWVDAVVRWLNLRKWDACAPDKTAWKRWPDELLGRRCFLTFDVSATRDVTFLLLLFPPVEEGERWKAVCRCWLPEEVVATRVADDGAPYDKFIAVGAMETTPGDYVDQNYVQAAINEALARYDVERGGFDPWNARKLIADLQADDGVDSELFLEMRQGILTLGEPSKAFERMVYAGEFDHGGHPVLRWMAANAIVRFDENMNFAPAKKRSPEKIDGIVCAVMAVGLANMEEAPVDLDDFLKNAVVV